MKIRFAAKHFAASALTGDCRNTTDTVLLRIDVEIGGGTD